MAFSTFGTLYKVSTFGESHCKGVGAIVDGCPAGMELSEADIPTPVDTPPSGSNRGEYPASGRRYGYDHVWGRKRENTGYSDWFICSE